MDRSGGLRSHMQSKLGLMALARPLSLVRISSLEIRVALFLATTFYWYRLYDNVAARCQALPWCRDFGIPGKRP